MLSVALAGPDFGCNSFSIYFWSNTAIFTTVPVATIMILSTNYTFGRKTPTSNLLASSV